MKLFGDWRSTTSYRAHAALKLLGLVYETVPTQVLDGGTVQTLGTAQYVSPDNNAMDHQPVIQALGTGFAATGPQGKVWPQRLPDCSCHHNSPSVQPT